MKSVTGMGGRREDADAGDMETDLEGVTLLRYAHADRSRDFGGTEQYLGQLNDGLLARNRMTIVQMHLVPDSPSMPIEIEPRGRGRIVWVPVAIQQESRSLRSIPRRLMRWLRNTAAIEFRGIWSLYPGILGAMCSAYGQFWAPEIVLSEGLAGLLEAYNVDLMLFHSLSHDVGPLVSRAKRRRTPYAVIHHFDNSRLKRMVSRVWVRDAVVVGGVSGRNVPGDVQGKYVNVSDAVDGEFFSPDLARPVARPDGFVVLLPSRIVAGKGHADVLVATRVLVEAGANPFVVFAGAIVSESLRAELERMAADSGLAERVRFLGRLSAVDLRDWYGASDVVVLPSSSEGLGRVLLEAQAMATPVVAYDSGGVPEALVPEESGFLVEPNDAETLAARLQFLLDHPTARARMGRCGREFVLKHFQVGSLVERHERLYAQLLAGRRRGR